jgi:hypothetical protein
MNTRALAALLLSALSAGPAAAQATRTWVSGVGDDANPCSRTAPCKTFAGAISKTAAGGEINVLDPGGYGAVTITKAISIEADGEMAGVLVSGTNGIVVQAGDADTVVLRGLTIEGVGTGLNGILWNSGGNLVIEKCTIKGFEQKAVFAQPTSAAAGFSANLFITDTQIRDNNNVSTGGGVHGKPRGTAALKGTLSRVQFTGNTFGVRAEDNAYLNLKDCITSQSVGDGILAHGNFDNAVIYVESSVSANNGGFGVHASGPSYVFMSNVLVTGNHVGLGYDTGGHIVSFGNNRNAGNFTGEGAPSSTNAQQ